MKRLYIIGNGFDLYHGLPTSYLSFKDYLKNNNIISYDNFNNSFYYYNDINDLWANFEENLSNLDTETVIDRFSDYLPHFSIDFRDRDMGAFDIEIKNFVNSITTSLKFSFVDFIKDAVKKGKQNKILRSFCNESKFISFNYTNTLEKLYSVNKKDILYIHGNIYDDNEDIILGHGVEPCDIDFGNYISNIDNNGVFVENAWLDCESDFINIAYNEGAATLEQYYLSSFKNTEKILVDNEKFFDSLFNIEEVYVLGHSLSDVDLPYFYRLVKILPRSTKWIVSYYTEEEKIANFFKVVDLGIEEDSIKMITINDLKLP
ncbi:bacteriophage abortive infection AbiH family protein [Vibrio parahaemolyticus]